MQLTRHARPRWKVGARLVPQRDVEAVVKQPAHVRAALVMELYAVKHEHPDVKVSDAAANGLDRIRRAIVKAG